MKSTSISIADKIDPTARYIYDNVNTVANALGVGWLVVGATARDMIYHAAFDVQIKRGTEDIDFAIHVDDWETFNVLTTSLIEDYGYTRRKSEHRLDLPDSKLWIDIVPFGAIADKDGKFRWPNDPDKEISMLGFQDALETAVTCRISEDPVFDLKVVHPAVLILLKIISWRDRKHYKRTDAQDVAYAMRHYIDLDANDMRVYDDPTLYEGNLDMGTVGARLAGRDLKSLVTGNAIEVVRKFIEEELALGNKSEFLADMMQGSTKLFVDDSQYSELLTDFSVGINE